MGPNHRKVLHMPSRNSLLCIVLSLATLLSAHPATAAITPEQRREITDLSMALGRITRLFDRDQFKRSGEEFADLQLRVEQLAKDADSELIAAMGDLHRKMVRAHALLELEGVELKPLADLGPGKPAPTPGGGISFVRDIAPLLVAKCGRCHVDQQRGEFSMRDYATLMQGPSAGVVVFPKDPDGSRIVEVIESGDMPRGGSLSEEEFTALKNWIAAGALFDGENRQAYARRQLSHRGPLSPPVDGIASMPRERAA